ncbi:ATP-binding protein [Actinomadura chibensis]|uniref:ATP-binding protein n=1 Tax=Actinomadura chibensis TaxID=392828 RepID=A0A5D0NWD4_9ACTN|nr:ATP-binding protein [Actinomadura chibensis]
MVRALVEGTSAGPLALRRGFLATPDVIRQGRLIVEAQTLQWELPQGTVDDAVLIASELLTNAVRATPNAPISLRMALVEEGLRIGVWDTSPERPKTSAPDLSMPTQRIPDNASDPGGWGLGIIASLSKYYGCRPEHDGKCVWAVLDIDPPHENGVSP